MALSRYLRDLRVQSRSRYRLLRHSGPPTKDDLQRTTGGYLPTKEDFQASDRAFALSIYILVFTIAVIMGTIAIKSIMVVAHVLDAYCL